METTTLDSLHVESRTFQYAGFWIRVVAYLIDAIILSIVQSVFGLAFGISMFMMPDPENPLVWAALAPMILVSIFVQWLYFALLESSSRQATIGKMAVGIVVTDMAGQRISFMNATGRYLGKFLSSLLLLIGYIMVAFSAKKQGLHDVLAKTLVIYK